MEIIPFGDQALLVRLKQEVSTCTHARVMAIAQAIQAHQHQAVTYLIPAYASLTVGFAPDVATYAELSDWIRNLPGTSERLPMELQARHWSIPVCYHPDFGLDLGDLEKSLGLSVPDIIDLHTRSSYRVFMLGFLPGFPYMGDLCRELEVSRKASPRPLVPASSVGIAGRQTGIYPLDAPGGWQIIGRCPMPVFSMGEQPSFLFGAGDEVSFEPVSKSQFLELESGWRSGRVKWDAFLA